MHYGFRIVKDINQTELLYDLADVSLKSNKELSEFSRQFCKPCLWKDGKVIAYLDHDNYKKLADGTYVSQRIKDMTNVEYMMQFPRLYYRYSSLEAMLKNNEFIFEISDHKEDLLFDSPISAFKPNKDKKEFKCFYTGIFEGHIDDKGKLRSIPDAKISKGLSSINFINAAKSTYRRAGIMDENQLCYIFLLILMLIIVQMDYNTDNLDSNLPKIEITGTAIKEEMFYEGIPSKKEIKLFGLEGFFTNYKEVILSYNDEYSSISKIVRCIKENEYLPEWIPFTFPKSQNYRNPESTARLTIIEESTNK